MSIIHDLYGVFRREYYSRKIKAVHSLVYFTYRCTSQCRTCNIWKRNKTGAHEELNLAGWLRIFEKLKNYGTETVEIFGGDALLRKELIYEAIKFCSKNSIKTYFPTNSILLDREAAKNLVEAGLDTIYFSLDDVGAESDRIRGKTGTFHTVRNAIENILHERKNGKPNSVVITTISNMNYHHFSDIVKFLNDYPIDAIYPRVLEEYSKDNIKNSAVNGILPEPYFTPSDGQSHLLALDEAHMLRKSIKELKSNGGANRLYINSGAVDMVDDDVLTKGIHPHKQCLICTILATIDPMGNVVPCPMYNRYILGNIRTDAMEDLWGNRKHHIFVDHQRQRAIQICRNCSLRAYYPSIRPILSYYYKKFTKAL